MTLLFSSAMGRRLLVSFTLLLISYISILAAKKVNSDPYRTAYHFQPHANWMNDPNGADTSVIGRKVKHVLKVSLYDLFYEYYTIRTYDTNKDIYVPDEGSTESVLGLRYDYGKFYASKSFYYSISRRRILWGWVNEFSTHADNIKKGWSGLQAIPRTILLDKSGKQLVQWPIKEVESLRENPVIFPSRVLRTGSANEVPGVGGSQVDVEISFRIPVILEDMEALHPSWINPQILCSRKGATVAGTYGPFGMLTLASGGLEEYTAVFFRVFKDSDTLKVLMCSDQSKSSLNPTTDKQAFGAFVDVKSINDELTLRILSERQRSEHSDWT